MRRDDGRAVPTLIERLNGKPITVHGDGSQTRSLCFVDDLIEGIWRYLQSDVIGQPVNLGNPQEVTVLDLARESHRSPQATPRSCSSIGRSTTREVRCPDISLARS